ncbi:MAG: minichromosome maintenance protein MCM [archaeon]|nr:minichromosome maintenance protein MCM [archaeon]
MLELAADPEVFEKMAASIAPSIWGYDEIKKALVLQMLGGVRKVSRDRSVKRGDLHVLLIGDPGVAKSQILKFISELAPKGRYVVGRATSGAGITATVVKDEFLRGWALEAGAMVLANKGIVCIDELEKMDPHDRSAMHEALEQQSVTISKANIQATLQAQTAVLAAGNPKLGRFEPFQTIAQQIDLPPTLINRFDVIFTLRDLPDKIRDESIAAHVLSQYKKDDKLVAIDRELFRKYVAYAKQKIKPILTDEAINEIKNFYVKMRNSPVSADAAGIRSIPISARQLEALVRLSEAHAKMRLSKKVTKEDAKIAIDIIKYYMMQVGYDPETKSFDIDRIAVGVSTSQRSKVIVLRETIGKLEERLGKFIPLEELEKELQGKLTREEIDDSIQKLKASGDIFEPRKGFVQKV